MKFSNRIKTVLKIYPKYVKNSVWFGTGYRLGKNGKKPQRESGEHPPRPPCTSEN